MLKRVQMEKTSVRWEYFLSSVYLDNQHLPFSQCSEQSRKASGRTMGIEERPYAHCSVYASSWETAPENSWYTQLWLPGLFCRPFSTGSPFWGVQAHQQVQRTFHLQSPSFICLVYQGQYSHFVGIQQHPHCVNHYKLQTTCKVWARILYSKDK